MGNGGQRTVSATEFATLTGLSRERLRTWERRHGFPEPIRSDGGRRRYAAEDVTRVLIVRRAVEQGVPLAVAIAAAELPAGPGISDDARSALADRAPVAIVVLSGPRPLRIEWTNALVRERPAAPAHGADLLELAPWYASEPGARAIERLFTTDAAATACDHPDWLGGLSRPAQSLAFRLPQERGAPPLVALIGIDTGRERRTRKLLDDADRERAMLLRRLEDERRFGEAAGALATLFRDGSGTATLAEAASVLVRRLGAVDVALAPYMTGALVLGRSARGLLGPEMVTVSRFDDLADIVRAGTPGWLPATAASAFGAPGDMSLLAIPLAVAGETLGALLVLHDEEHDLDDGHRRLLGVIGALLAFALVREQVAGELRNPE